MSDRQNKILSPYTHFSRAQWARLRAGDPMTLSEYDIAMLGGISEPLTSQEVREVYLSLSRLLNLYVGGAQKLHAASSQFLGNKDKKMPFIVGLAGSVAVGKSTTARVLQALLAHWPNHPRIELLPTDGFLFPNNMLETRGIMDRKGFPESYNLPLLLRFLADIKAGRRNVKAPVYSHLIYDVMEGETISFDQPDILIVEGLNVLQPATLPRDGQAIPFVSDYFDFSIYIDANAEIIENWYVERFLKLQQTAFRDPASYFHRYAELGAEKARATARDIWQSINLVNLEENILPTRQRADLILHKDAEHVVDKVALRKL